MTLSIISAEENEVLELLKKVVDPELMVNIVDLGLVYGVQKSSKTKAIIISITLTSVGCPMGDVIMQDIENTLFRYYPDYKITVQLVWNPKWSPDMASEEGKLALTEF